MRHFLFFFCIMVFCMAGWAQTVTAPYRLGPEDVVTITVQRHPEFSSEVLIPSDGVVNLPVCGKVQVSGLTTQELTQLVTKGLSERLRKPEVVVTLKSQRMQRIYVTGAVAQPGVYDLKPGWRVLEALTAAGGAANGGKLKSVVLVRTKDGKEERQTCNIEEFLKTANAAHNPTVQAGDTIFVPTKRRIDWQAVAAVVSIIGIAAGLSK